MHVEPCFVFYIGHNSFKDVTLYKNKLDLILMYVRVGFLIHLFTFNIIELGSSISRVAKLL